MQNFILFTITIIIYLQLLYMYNYYIFFKIIVTAIHTTFDVFRKELRLQCDATNKRRQTKTFSHARYDPEPFFSDLHTL